MEPDTDLKVAVPGPEKVSPRSRPVFVAADRLQGHSDREVEAIGKAELNNGEQFISAERLKYRQERKMRKLKAGSVWNSAEIYWRARGSSSIWQQNGRVQPAKLSLKDASSRGYADMLCLKGRTNTV